MAYENQDRCQRCGKPIPPMPEDARKDELLCDLCYQITEDVANADVSVKNALEIIRDLAVENTLDLDACMGDENLYDEAIKQEKAFEVFDNFVRNVLN